MPEKQAVPTFYRRSIFKVIGANWFKLRQESGDTITYRKHLFVLWQQVWQPTLLIILILFGILARLITLARSPDQSLFSFSPSFRVDTIAVSLPVVLIPLIVWWIYQYIDWSNDIYQVTPDQILDIDKKPFGTEERRAAPLENILSTEAHRYGLTGYFLNFGTVEITVGGTHLDFEDVLDPVGVQADIDRRREARIKQKRDLEATARAGDACPTGWWPITRTPPSLSGMKARRRPSRKTSKIGERPCFHKFLIHLRCS